MNNISRFLTCLALLFTELFGLSSTATAQEETLVFSLRRWQGEYETNDVPGKVQSTPSTETIYSVGLNGESPREIVAIEDAACAVPTFSPDGKWLYFQSDAAGEYHLFRCRPDGSDRQQLTSSERPGPPWKSVYGLQVTPQGRLLSVVSDGRSGRVALFSADGLEVRLLAPHLGYLYMSAISPAEDMIVCAGPASAYRLWLFHVPQAFASGENKVSGPTIDLVPDHPESFVPQFTPDGRTIIYFRRDGDIYRVNSDGTDRRRLTTGNRYVEFRLSPKDTHGSTDGPRLSPDGKRIAFIALRDDVPNLCTIDLDGGNFQQLTHRKTPCGRARWNRDGKKIAFVSFEGKLPQLFVIAADGGEPKQLTQLDGAVYWMDWKP